MSKNVSSTASESNPTTPQTFDYGPLLKDIKERIRDAQYQALRAVNQELIKLYWDIGRIITERQQGQSWGRSIVERLAKDLQIEFPGMAGFSASNLWRIRQFYQTYQPNEKLAPLVREIGWTHNVLILETCSDPLEREFYIRMTRRMGWSKNVLIHQIENKTYEKTMANHTNFKETLPPEAKDRAHFAVKDEYTFDFLRLQEDHSEQDLEKALISKMNRFLIEMGGVFAFIGSQYRLEISDKEYFIDILLYHRRLNCLVAIELKTGEFKPEYVGKMQFYLAALDDLVKQKHEKPSIGIILCKKKDKLVVEYALKESRKPIGVSRYRIVSQVPKKLERELPAPEQISRLLDNF